MKKLIAITEEQLMKEQNNWTQFETTKERIECGNKDTITVLANVGWRQATEELR